MEKQNHDDKLLRAYQDAYSVWQGACNGVGILKSLAKHIDTVREDSTNGMSDFNHHPVIVLFVSQLSHLANTEDTTNIFRSIDKVRLYLKENGGDLYE